MAIERTQICNNFSEGKQSLNIYHKHSPLIPHEENMKKITKRIGETSYLIQNCMFLMKIINAASN
jgi:hypothetical protein